MLNFFLVLLFTYSHAMAYEESPFNIVHQTDVYEIRHYIDRLAVQATYTNQDSSFIDLCVGPHLPDLGFIGSYKLTKVSGAYWKGDSQNEMLTRVYGTAWRNKKELDKYLDHLVEAEKRDHRKIGKELDLFSIQEEAGGGLVFWHPNGSRIRNIIEDFWKAKHKDADYELLYSPHIALDSLWETSGHADFYQESMFKAIEDENQYYQLKLHTCLK